MFNILMIGAGGFLGAISRYLLSSWVGQRLGRTFPMGTFAVNILGCFIIGLLMTLFTDKFLMSYRWRLFLIIGFVGSFTTFSTFEYETGALLHDGEWFMAAMNVVLSLFIGFIALKAGEILARSIYKPW